MSGPGGSGTAYRFSAATMLTGPVHIRVSISGTVDVDRQGRVRRLDVLESFRADGPEDRDHLRGPRTPGLDEPAARQGGLRPARRMAGSR